MLVFFLYFQVSVTVDLYSSAVPRHPSARYGIFKFGDLYISFYVKLRTLSWIKDTENTGRKFLSISLEVASKMNVNKSKFVTEDKMNVSVSEGAQHYIQVFKAFIDAVPVCVWLAAPNSW
jgi:hypothetical protein